MKRGWLGCSLLLAWLALLAVPAWAELTLRDDRGVTLHFDRPPQRIVSLLPSLTEAVCALDACSRLVGVDRYSDWPARVLKLPRLGGLDDVQIERTLALKPDLVLMSSSERVSERLQALGLKVMVLDSQTHADVQRTLVLLARMLGEPAKGELLWVAIQQQIGSAAARVPARLRGRKVYYEVDPTPFAASEDSFIGQTLKRLGMGNAVPAAMGSFPALNPEYVVRAQPDIIMSGRAELATMAARPGWSGLRALRQHQTCGFDTAASYLLVRPGPRLGEAAMLLADCLAALPPLR